MKAPRIYTDQPLTDGGTLVLEVGPSRHLLKALRLKVGASVELFCGDGYDYRSTIITANRSTVELRIDSISSLEPKPDLQINLAIGISKGERMDFAIQKAVELGVNNIMPLITDFTVVRISHERQQKRLKHWQSIIISACEQSGRSRLPTCHEVAPFTEWLKTTYSQPCLLLDPRAKQALAELSPPETQITLLVGPEGGLSEAECQHAITQGSIGVRLGPRVLRTETAPVAAIAAVQTLWGDFG